MVQKLKECRDARVTVQARVRILRHVCRRFALDSSILLARFFLSLGLHYGKKKLWRPALLLRHTWLLKFSWLCRSSFSRYV